MNRQRNLSLECHSSNVQFVAKAFLVRGFEQAGAKVAMNFDGATDNDACSWIALMLLRGFRPGN
jgi:hypothetical protein